MNEVTTQFKSARLISESVKRFHYHNPNYRLLAQIVESVSREPFADYLQEHILKPLEMTHTSEVSATQSFYTGPGRVDKGHIFVIGTFVAIQEPDCFVEGAVWIRSTVSDMAHWLSLQLTQGRIGNRKLLSRAFMTLMHTSPA
ncbi:hypothetical protein GCM10028817_36370 [Spirosoma pomorum]